MYNNCQHIATASLISYAHVLGMLEHIRYAQNFDVQQYEHKYVACHSATFNIFIVTSKKSYDELIVLKLLRLITSNECAFILKALRMSCYNV